MTIWWQMIFVPDKSQKYYREKLPIFLIVQSNNPDFIQKEYVKRGYFDLPEDAFIFTHFNSDYKVDRKTWLVWLNILKKVPNSILVFTILTSKKRFFETIDERCEFIKNRC